MKQIVLYLIFSFSIGVGFGQKNIEIKEILHLEDSTNKLEFSQLNEANFHPATSQNLNLGFSSYTHWYSLKLSSETEESVINIVNSEIDYIDLYCITKNGDTVVFKNGNLSGQPKNEISRNLHFNLAPFTKEIYIRVFSETPLSLFFEVKDERFLQKENTLEILCFTGLHVLLLFLFFYNLLLFFKIRHIIYLYYASYLFFVFFLGLNITGYTSYFLEGKFIWLNKYSTLLAVTGMLYTFCLFTMDILQLKKHSRWVYFCFVFFVFLSPLVLGIVLFGTRALSFKILHVLPILAMSLAVIGAISVIKKGNKTGVYYLIGWVCFFSGAIIIQLRNWGILPNNFWTINLNYFGVALEALFFAYSVSQTLKNYHDKLNVSTKKLSLVEIELEKYKQQLINPQTSGIEIQNLSKSKINEYLLNPLTERELDVLVLLSQGKTNKEVSEELFISLNTVKTHIKNIYSKLDVTNRTEALNQANSLKII